ncbi:hypothetical protein [Micromonospora sp. NBC_01796]|uniref:hypothetical protein n=1 Tax=Micromonospora sp. NBC_01796 TaxID=2975987 RepID=UPI002DDC88D8|nr:hypothetical protein [Micromonospora sp. NBC_01796]WSA88952.1 hypothetical protein OIE47_15810 [Micromonospora sp. NBC_01796]
MTRIRAFLGRKTAQFGLLAVALVAISGLVVVNGDLAQARANDRAVTTTYLLRGKGPVTNQSDQLYVTSGTQATCKKGKKYLLTATWYARNVTKTSAYIDKVVVRYSAGIKGKSVFLAKGELYDASGKNYWGAGTADHVKISGGRSLTVTHHIRKTVSFAKGPVTFKRYATVGGTGQEAVWCHGPAALQIQLRPSR